MTGVERIQLEPARRPPTYAAWSHAAPPRPAAARSASATSSTAPRATRSSSRSWSAPRCGPRAAASPKTSPTCSWSGSRASTTPRVTVVRAAAVAGRRVSHAALSAVVDLVAADARPGGARRRRGPRAGAEPRRLLRSSATRCSPRRCTTTCCPASAPRSTRPTRGPSRRAAPSAPPPSWPGTPASPRTTPPPSPRACAPATTPAASAVPRRPRSTTSRRSSCGTTPGCPTTADLDYPRLVGLVSDALIAAGHPARALGVVREQLDHLPPDAADSVRGQLLGVLAGAARDDRDPARTRSRSRREAVGAGARRADQRPGQGAGGPRPDAGPRPAVTTRAARSR